MSTRTCWTVLTMLLGLNVSPGDVIGEERCYMLVFGAQAEPNLPRFTHVHAYFVRVADGKWGHGSEKMEGHCISWLPRTLSVEPLRRFPEPGVNLGLGESNRLYASLGAQIAMWGPYRVTRELYDMAVKQAARLNNNELNYICLDWRYRGNASNCIHAVSDLDTTQPLLATGVARGFSAAALVVGHFARYIVPSTEDTSWLLQRLKIDSTQVSQVGASR
jgi:hypothetical protein